MKENRRKVNVMTIVFSLLIILISSAYAITITTNTRYYTTETVMFQGSFDFHNYTNFSLNNKIINSKGEVYNVSESNLQYAMNSTGCYWVQLPSCNITITKSLKIPSNMWLKGMGKSSLLYLDNNANITVIRTEDTNNIHLSDFAVDGNAFHQPYGDWFRNESYASRLAHGMFLTNVQNLKINNVKIRNTVSFGIYIGGTWNELPTCKNIFIDNCYTEKIGYIWYSYVNPSGSIQGRRAWQSGSYYVNSAENITITNCISNNSFGHAFGIETIGALGIPKLYSKNWIISNCIAIDGYAGYWIEEAKDGIISNCIAYNCTNKYPYTGQSPTGIQISTTTTNITISNCKIMRCGNVNSNNGSGIIFSSNGMIDNCFINNISGVGIRCIDNTIINSCILYNISGFGIYYNGRNPIITNNLLSNINYYNPVLTSGAINVNGNEYSIRRSNRVGTISNNNIQNCSSNGIINFLYNVSINDNSISYVLGHGISLYNSPQFVKISGNRINYVVTGGKDGINTDTLSGSGSQPLGNYTITENIITNIADSAIQIKNTNCSIISENIISLCGNEGIKEVQNCNKNEIINNILTGTATGIKITLRGNNTIVRGNIGYITESSGTCSIASGGSTIRINHNLSSRPNSITVVPLGNTTCVNGANGFNVSYSTTQISIYVPGKLSNTCKFYWAASNITGGSKNPN